VGALPLVQPCDRQRDRGKEEEGGEDEGGKCGRGELIVIAAAKADGYQ
jgi:hypothetical protein